MLVHSGWSYPHRRATRSGPGYVTPGLGSGRGRERCRPNADERGSTRKRKAVLLVRRLEARHGGNDGDDCGAAHLDGAAVAMVHARVATAGRAHGGRLLRHAAHRLGMTQHRPGEWPELKQKKQRCEHLHSSILALAQRLDKAGLRMFARASPLYPTRPRARALRLGASG